MVLDKFSDYGSGSSSNSNTSWGIQEPWPMKPSQGPQGQKSSSFLDLVTGKCSLDDALEEFRLNGLDTPYNPDEDRVWGTRLYQSDKSVGPGAGAGYLRQKSWPAPERSPAPQLPRPASAWLPTDTHRQFDTIHNLAAPQRTEEPPAALSPEQARVLAALPDGVLYSLLRDLELERGLDRRPRPRRALEQECRFCKNNGERESYYRGHSLKAGGRVQCPVLRAFVCRRCGASGDTAHTAKYCPLATHEERLKSAAMMRSVRLASGRRRGSCSSPAELVVFGAAPAALHDGLHSARSDHVPLDPLWAALEQKLML